MTKGLGHVALGLFMVCAFSGCSKAPPAAEAPPPGEELPLPDPASIRTLIVDRTGECTVTDRHAIDLAMAILMEHPTDWHTINHDLGPAEGKVEFRRGPGKAQLILWFSPDWVRGGMNENGVVPIRYLTIDKETLKDLRDAVQFDTCIAPKTRFNGHAL